MIATWADEEGGAGGWLIWGEGRGDGPCNMLAGAANNFHVGDSLKKWLNGEKGPVGFF